MIEKFKYAVSALAVAFLVYIFTFYVDGEMGMILIAFVLGAPLISLALVLYARKNIKVSFNCDAYVKKGNKLKVTVNVEKKNMIPFPFIEIKPFASDVFIPDNKIYRFSMFNAGKSKFDFELAANVGGHGEVGISEIWSSGFLGFMRFKIKDCVPENFSVGVIPEIPDVKASSALVRSIANVVATSENDEDNDTAMLYTSNTVPGYEHREYIQGDALKRINWKLSTKKSKLMVRLDEAAASVQPVVVLDLYRPDTLPIENAIRIEERIICSVFGLMETLVKQGVASTFLFRSNSGEVVSENIDDPDYIPQVLLKVLDVKIENNTRIDIRHFSGSVCALIAATTDAGEGFEAITSSVGECENITIIGESLRAKNSTSYPLWYLDEDNNFKMV